ncbi:hypothetical protein IMZ48_05495 [Candidatus Bathyarchaeota archaeon]|nr:hypothetical protein [Candidatus Bathyarchaeota archaeon]
MKRTCTPEGDLQNGHHEPSEQQPLLPLRDPRGRVRWGRMNPGALAAAGGRPSADRSGAVREWIRKAQAAEVARSPMM